MNVLYNRSSERQLHPKIVNRQPVNRATLKPWILGGFNIIIDKIIQGPSNATSSNATWSTSQLDQQSFGPMPFRPKPIPANAILFNGHLANAILPFRPVAIQVISANNFNQIKGGCADHILIPQGSTGSSAFLMPNESPYFSICTSEISASKWFL